MNIDFVGKSTDIINSKISLVGDRVTIFAKIIKMYNIKCEFHSDKKSKLEDIMSTKELGVLKNISTTRYNLLSNYVNNFNNKINKRRFMNDSSKNEGSVQGEGVARNCY